MVDQKKLKILKLAVNKASQSSDIPIKILKEKADTFIIFFCNSFNNSIKLSTFPGILKHAEIFPLCTKNVKKISKETTDQ